MPEMDECERLALPAMVRKGLVVLAPHARELTGGRKEVEQRVLLDTKRMIRAALVAAVTVGIVAAVFSPSILLAGIGVTMAGIAFGGGAAAAANRRLIRLDETYSRTKRAVLMPALPDDSVSRSA